MMNRDTHGKFDQFIVEVKPSETENLLNLRLEYDLYSLVSKQAKRLKQKHISQNFAVKYLSKCLMD